MTKAWLMLVVPPVMATKPPLLANGLKIVPLPVIVPLAPLTSNPPAPLTTPLLRLSVPLLVNVALPRLNGNAEERFKVPRLTLPLPLSASVPPPIVSVPSLSSPRPLSVIVRPEEMVRMLSFSSPLPAVKSALKVAVPALISRPLKVPEL